MKSITRDISLLDEYDYTTWYTHTCSCGCGEQVTIEVVSSEDIELISIEMYAEVTSFNRDIFKQFLSYAWFKQFLSDIWWRFTTSLRVLFKGSVSLQTGICINSKQGIEDYIKALTEASGVFKEDQHGRK